MDYDQQSSNHRHDSIASSSYNKNQKFRGTHLSTLNNLLRQVWEKDPQLAADLRREVEALEKRRAFGLNFERHTPETVELPGRPVRRGDKVRFLPERGEPPSSVNRTLWIVASVRKEPSGRVADLVRLGVRDDAAETTSRNCDDLVVVAEFRDPIYPGLVSTGKVQRGGDKPFHSVINAENFHALQALLYTHEGKVDAIYIDPPYNTGAKDWKYNNDYVDGEDAYRHSKWLAFMERRLKVAKRLLNPRDSVLIVTIDEKEYLRLGLLLEQSFNGCKIEMISSVINPKGTGRSGDFARTNEFLFFVRFGSATVAGIPDEENVGDEATWETMRRRNLASVRGRKGKGACGPNQFFPIFVDKLTGAIVGRGEPLPKSTPRHSVDAPGGSVAVFPVRPDGTEMNWEYTDVAFDNWWPKGFIRANGFKDQPQAFIIQHLPNKVRSEIAEGIAIIEGRREDGSVIAKYAEKTFKHVTTQWNFTSHSAEHGGTGILKYIIPERRFPFPKSLYAVEDALRFFVVDKPEAVVLDFFSGSGTTCHAVMRLNNQDGGRRQCISVTNNEVSAEEQKGLRERGLRPGDTEWEALGICDYITKPRISAAITGRTPDGEPAKGHYKFKDEFPMADGFAENVEFFTLTYEAPRPIAHHRSFSAVAPLLWLKAGAQGRRIDQASDTFAVADSYAVLFDLDAADNFLRELREAESVRMAFIVTDDDRGYQAICGDLPPRVEAVRLYASYLTNFTINTGRD